MTDDRAASTALGYVLTLSITTILVSGLLISSGSFVTNQRTSAVRTELDVVGQHLANGLSTANRLNQTTGTDGRVELTVALPAAVAGTDYRINVSAAGSDHYTLTLSTATPHVAVTVTVISRTPIGATEIGGGTVVIAWNETAGNLEVTDD